MKYLKFFFFFLLFSIPVTISAAADPWVVMADIAEGRKGEAVASDSSSVFSLAKSILARVAVGEDVTDLVKTFLDQFVREGQIGNPVHVHDDFWGVLALRAGGIPKTHPAIADARTFILRSQHPSGGWSWSPTYPVPDTDDTAAGVMALLEAGLSRSDGAITRALAFFRSKQNSDGGFPNVSGQSSIDSTAWVLAALNTLGEDGTKARKFLQSKKQADGTWGAPATTAFVRIALAGKMFPVRSVGALVFPSGDTLRDRGRSPCSAGEAPPGTLCPTTSRSQAPGLPSPALGESSIDPFAIVGGGKTGAPSTPTSEALPPSPYRTSSVFPSRTAISISSAPETIQVVNTTQDSDGDGYADEVEMAHGYDPHDPAPCRKKVYSTMERNVYGGMRLASVVDEQCRSRYLRGVLEEKRGGSLRLSPHNWLVRVNAYLYGGYTLEEIAMWG